MSDAVQPQPQPPRVPPPRSTRDRITTSCGECRRRKQKCSQGQPCANCLRRFPQPVCEYKTSRRRNPPGVSSHPTFTVALRSPSPKNPGNGNKDSHVDGDNLPWIKSHDGGRRSGLGHGGEVAVWSGVNMTTQYPSAVSLERLVNLNDPEPPAEELELVEVTRCGPGCTKHSQAVHNAVSLIADRVTIPDKFLVPWNSPSSATDYIAFAASSLNMVRWSGLVKEFDSLPMVPSKQNNDLLKIWLKLISRYKTCLDGNPDPDNPIVKHYFPFCIQDPLLLQIILYTSSCFLNETGHMPKMGVMAHKGKAINMLNTHLRSQTHQTGDSVIAGVVQLIIDEWYWGDTDDLRAHMRGLREMIRIRGGFHNLGMDGLLAKMVICHDIGISVAHEIKTFLGDHTKFDFRDSTIVPFRIAHNSPFVNNLPSFAASAEALGLHPITASILDDVRFLINAVTSLPNNPSPEDLQKIATMSAWMYERISKLPKESPDGRAIEDSKFRNANCINTNGAAVPAEESAWPTYAGEDTLSPDSGLGSETSYAGREGSVASQAQAQAQAQAQTQDGAMAVRPKSNPSSPRYQDEALRPDFIYRVVRTAALINIRAVQNREPMSKTCTMDEFLTVWTTSWRVPLTTWRGMVGIFNWIMVTIVPLSHGDAHERFVRSMFMISMVSRAMEDWGLFMAASAATMRLQAWLAVGWGKKEGGKLTAGGDVVRRHGFLNTGWE